ncbi:unnamed protein product [Allacma fusca]|uniref:Uncharacterized protein n=1 Tax=Allacma fusca TaxID=39272 RepID=A0A8J2JNK2_9HEXA|nr:unnamed protein product [Allacma fusca]
MLKAITRSYAARIDWRGSDEAVDEGPEDDDIKGCSSTEVQLFLRTSASFLDLFRVRESLKDVEGGGILTGTDCIVMTWCLLGLDKLAIFGFPLIGVRFMGPSNGPPATERKERDVLMGDVDNFSFGGVSSDNLFFGVIEVDPPPPPVTLEPDEAEREREGGLSHWALFPLVPAVNELEELLFEGGFDVEPLVTEGAELLLLPSDAKV